MSEVYSAGLEGDTEKALRLLAGIDHNALDDKARVAAACLRSRFVDGVEPPAAVDLPAPVAQILHSYRSYWTQVMLRRSSRARAEEELLRQLNAVLADRRGRQWDRRDLDATSEEARVLIGEQGLHALTGVTAPYRELMIWRSRTPVSYRVELPERTVNVSVVFLDNFVSLGWSAYATCEHSYNGGWSTSTELYAVRPAYDVASENFRVSYLGHEGQHFADYQDYPKLEQPELEYRAKLAELALSQQTTHALVVSFAQRTGRSRDVPHHFADYWVVRRLATKIPGADATQSDAARWNDVPPERIREAAKALLHESSAAMRARNAATVARFLDG